MACFHSTKLLREESTRLVNREKYKSGARFPVPDSRFALWASTALFDFWNSPNFVPPGPFLAKLLVEVVKKVVMAVPSRPAAKPNIFWTAWTASAPRGINTKIRDSQKKRPGTWPGLWYVFSYLVNSPNYFLVRANVAGASASIVSGLVAPSTSSHGPSTVAAACNVPV